MVFHYDSLKILAFMRNSRYSRFIIFYVEMRVLSAFDKQTTAKRAYPKSRIYSDISEMSAFTNVTNITDQLPVLRGISSYVGYIQI